MRGDDELLRRTPKEPEAFGEFYARHETAILGFMLRRTGDPELAADLSAETFAAALVSVRRYKPGPAPAAAWLYGIARNVLARSVKRRRVEDRGRPGRRDVDALAVLHHGRTGDGTGVERRRDGGDVRVGWVGGIL